MDGRITVDGYNAEGFELHTHGGAPDPEAICSIVYRLDRAADSMALLEHMQKSIQTAINSEHDSCMKTERKDEI